MFSAATKHFDIREHEEKCFHEQTIKFRTAKKNQIIYAPKYEIRRGEEWIETHLWRPARWTPERAS